MCPSACCCATVCACSMHMRHAHMHPCTIAGPGVVGQLSPLQVSYTLEQRMTWVLIPTLTRCTGCLCSFPWEVSPQPACACELMLVMVV